MVPRDVIDEIRSRVDIVRLIGEVVPLKKAGRNYSGLCPFHPEKSPSFTVNEQKQLYHCFGCGEGGTIFTFMMNYHRLSFPETLERLAPIAGIDLARYRKDSTEIRARKEEIQGVLKVLSFAREAYHRAYLEMPQAEAARAYAEKRGISRETAKRIKLGFAPAGWESLVQKLEREAQPLDVAAKAGLIGKRTTGEGHYDVFRSRLLFPIQDLSGNTVGFGGRALEDDGPKYLNSPQTLVFDKGGLLYGLYEGAEAIRREKFAILVEGYIDQVSLVDAGFSHTVATLGTALTSAHVRLLQKHADQVFIVFDGDAAGRKAARRSLRPILAQGMKASVTVLPVGHDPDTFVRQQGAAGFTELLNTSTPILHYFLEEFYVKEPDVILKAAAAEELASILREMENPFLKEAVMTQASEISGLDPKVLRGDKAPKVFPAPAVASPRPVKRDMTLTREELVLLKICAEIPEARVRLVEETTLDLFTADLRETVTTWLGKLEELTEAEATSAALVDAWDDEGTRHLLSREFFRDDFLDGSAWERMWTDCVRKLRTRMANELNHRGAEAVQRGDEDTARKFLERARELNILAGRTGGSE